MCRLLGIARKEGTESNIVGSGLSSFHCKMPTVVTGRTDLYLATKQGASFGNVAVPPPEMDSIRSVLRSKFGMIVENERAVPIRAYRHKLLGHRQHCFFARRFHAQLEGGNRTRAERARKPIGKVRARVRGGDQIELTAMFSFRHIGSRSDLDRRCPMDLVDGSRQHRIEFRIVHVMPQIL